MQTYKHRGTTKVKKKKRYGGKICLTSHSFIACEITKFKMVKSMQSVILTQLGKLFHCTPFATLKLHIWTIANQVPLCSLFFFFYFDLFDRLTIIPQGEIHLKHYCTLRCSPQYRTIQHRCRHARKDVTHESDMQTGLYIVNWGCEDGALLKCNLTSPF